MRTVAVSGLLALLVGYSLEAGLMVLLQLDVPIASKLAGFLQLPSALFALSIPPMSIAPDAKKQFMVSMFLVQGFLFSLIVYVIFRRLVGRIVE
jgi:hypothetical protein